MERIDIIQALALGLIFLALWLLFRKAFLLYGKKCALHMGITEIGEKGKLRLKIWRTGLSFFMSLLITLAAALLIYLLPR